MSILKKQFYFVIITFLMFIVCVNFSSANYEIRDNGVYWDDIKMPDADPNTFETLVFPYFQDNNNVFYFNNLVEGADPATFEYISQNYIKDIASVYCRGQKIENVDRNTLIEMAHTYAKDKNNVYKNCSVLPEADYSSFKIITPYYTKDNRNVYCLDNIIKNAEPSSFEILGYTNHGTYAKDINHIYINGNRENEIFNVANEDMYNNLKGKIILAVEELGEAYYINTNFQIMHYLGRPDDAFSIMRNQGIGISNTDLNKIPIAINSLTGLDTDNDGLPDLFEDAVDSDKMNNDSDGDGYSDKEEIENGYMPGSSERYVHNLNYAKGQSGKIFLQVEGNGEAWYVNREDNQRYYL